MCFALWKCPWWERTIGLSIELSIYKLKWLLFNLMAKSAGFSFSSFHLFCILILEGSPCFCLVSFLSFRFFGVSLVCYPLLGLNHFFLFNIFKLLQTKMSTYIYRILWDPSQVSLCSLHSYMGALLYTDLLGSTWLIVYSLDWIALYLQRMPFSSPDISFVILLANI